MRSLTFANRSGLRDVLPLDFVQGTHPPTPLPQHTTITGGDRERRAKVRTPRTTLKGISDELRANSQPVGHHHDRRLPLTFRVEGHTRSCDFGAA